MPFKLLFLSLILQLNLFSNDNPFEIFKPTSPPAENLPFLGEKLYYNIYWSGIIVGYATIEVDSIVKISSNTYAYRIVSRAYSTSFIDNFFKVRDINIGFLDINLKRSYGYYKELNEGKYHVKEMVLYDYDTMTFKGWKEKKGKIEPVKGKLDGDVYDMLSALYIYRIQEIKPKQYIHVNTKKNWHLEIRKLKSEKIKVPYGKYKCYIIQPLVGNDGIFMAKKGKDLYIYISKKEKLPLMLEAEIFIGSIKAELTKYTRNLK